MSSLFEHHRLTWKRAGFRLSVGIGLAMLLASLLINYAAGTYATEVGSRTVTDLILDHVPVFDVGLVFIYGFAVFSLSVIALGLSRPQAIPFLLKSLALFIVIRAAAVTLTHIGPPFPHSPYPSQNDIVGSLTFGGDLFFSGHAGMPFLVALVFWKERPLRWLYLGVSIMFAITVLLGHLHYSIDVFAAYFITYGIYELAQLLFKEDRAFLRSTSLSAT